MASALGSQKQEGGTQERQGVGSKGFEERVSDQRVEEVCDGFFLFLGGIEGGGRERRGVTGRDEEEGSDGER